MIKSQAFAGRLTTAIWATALALAGVVVTLLVSRTAVYLGGQTDADALLFVALMRDLRLHDYAATAFQLGRIPSLAPDLLLQAAASAIAASPRWAIFIYNIFQFELLFVVAAYMVRLLTGAAFLHAVSVSLIVVSAVVAVDCGLASSTVTSLHYFEPVFHLGPHLFGFICVGLAWRILQGWRPLTAGFLFAFSTLAILSDRLVVISFTVPMALATMAISFALWRRWPPRVVALAAILAVSVVVAWVANHGFYHERNLSVDRTTLLARPGLFVADTLAFVQAHAIPVLTCVALPLLVFLAYLPLLGKVSAARAPKPLALGAIRLFGTQFDTVVVFLWLTAALGLCGVLAAMALLVYTDAAHYRYLTPVLIWPLIFTAATLYSLKSVRIMLYGVAILAFAASLSIVLSWRDPRPGIIAWRPDTAACLMAERRNLGLKAGFSNYNVARPTTFASDWTLLVNPATRDGHPYIWGDDPYEFTKGLDPPAGAPLYNFILLNGLDDGALLGRYGAPSRVYQCGGWGPLIWVYDDAQRMTDIFLADLRPSLGRAPAACADAIQAEDQLIARCPTMDGRWRYSRLDESKPCAGDIVANRDGSLACRRRPA